MTIDCHCEGFSPKQSYNKARVIANAAKQSYIDAKEIAASPTAPRNDIFTSHCEPALAGKAILQ